MIEFVEFDTIDNLNEFIKENPNYSIVKWEIKDDHMVVQFETSKSKKLCEGLDVEFTRLS